MDRSGKRRCIGKVHSIKLLQRCTHRQTADSNIDHLIHCTGADHLQSQKLMGSSVGNQSCYKIRGSRIIVRLVIRLSQYAYRIKACLLCLRLCQTGTAHIQIICQSDHTGSKRTAVEDLFSSQILCQTASGQICC